MITLPYQNVILKNGYLYDKQILNENIAQTLKGSAEI